MRLFHDFVRDVIGTVRLCRRHTAFVCLVVAVTALGIGLNTAMFTVLDAVLFRPLPAADPDRLVFLSINPTNFDYGNAGLPEQAFLDVREGDHLLDGLAATNSIQANLTGIPDPASIGVLQVTTNYFSVLGVQPSIGRAFGATEDNVIVISYWLWRTHLAKRPGVIGSHVTVNGIDLEVVGVMPEKPGPFWRHDAWVPLRVHPTHGFTESRPAIGRLKRTTTRTQLRSELDALASPSMTQMGVAHSEWTAAVTSVKDTLIGDVRRPLLFLSCAVAFLLLIACSNAASLFLARTQERSRELAVRAALGAGRGRLVRQLLTEGVFISLLGGAAGVLATVTGLNVIVRLVEARDLPIVGPVRVDLPVLAVACGLSILSGVLFGLAPAFGSRRASHAHATALRSVTRAHARTHAALVVIQVALSMTLLCGAGLLMKSLYRMRAVDAGFAPERLAVLSLDLPPSRYRSIADVRALHDAVLAAFKTAPGVQSAAAADFLPFGHDMFAGQLTLRTGQPPWPPDGMAYKMFVTTAYFDVMGIQLRRGRFLDDRDTQRTSAVALVSESFAGEAWPGQDPIGQRISESEHPTAADWITIVGVVNDVKQAGPTEDRALAIYRPFAQATPAAVTGQPSLVARTSFAIRATGDPSVSAAAIRSAVRSVDRDLPMQSLTSMNDLMAEAVTTPQFYAQLLGAFAALGLALTLIGIYGVLAYSVSRRTREFGICAALGADRQWLIFAILRQAMVMTVIGIGIGLIAAASVATTARAFFFEVTPADPTIMIGVSVLLLATSAIAAIIPAMRASRVDPAIALRAE
jgi:putative ABC transport system permease protein